MMDTGELLSAIDARGIRNRDIVRVLGVDPARVTEMRKGKRRILLDEAAKLSREFELESDPRVVPLPQSVNRLLVRHVAATLGCLPEGDDPRLAELAEDLRAFSVFVTDPKVRQSVDAAETFFQAMTLRHRERPIEGPQETDPAPAH